MGYDHWECVLCYIDYGQNHTTENQVCVCGVVRECVVAQYCRALTRVCAQHKHTHGTYNSASFWQGGGLW